MRITTQMLNETARKAGLPINNVSLLNYVNGSGNVNDNTLLGELSSGKSSKYSASSRLFQTDDYEKLEKSADELTQAAQALAAEGEDSLFAKAAQSGSYEALYDSIEKLTDRYNAVAKNLKASSGSLSSYYYQMLREAAQSNSDSLNAVGITIGKDGTLSLDKDKLKASSAEDMQKAVGSASVFTSKLAFLSGRIADNAKANAQSITSQYNSSGKSYASSRNQYDFWG